MKKIMLSCAAAFALFAMTSCGSPADKVAGYMNDAAEEIKDANGDVEKIQKITEECGKKCDEVTEGLSSEEKAELLKNDKVVQATADLAAAAAESAMKGALKEAE